MPIPMPESAGTVPPAIPAEHDARHAPGNSRAVAASLAAEILGNQPTAVAPEAKRSPMWFGEYATRYSETAGVKNAPVYSAWTLASPSARWAKMWKDAAASKYGADENGWESTEDMSLAGLHMSLQHFTNDSRVWEDIWRNKGDKEALRRLLYRESRKHLRTSQSFEREAEERNPGWTEGYGLGTADRMVRGATGMVGYMGQIALGKGAFLPMEAGMRYASARAPRVLLGEDGKSLETVREPVGRAEAAAKALFGATATYYIEKLIGDKVGEVIRRAGAAGFNRLAPEAVKRIAESAKGAVPVGLRPSMRALNNATGFGNLFDEIVVEEGLEAAVNAIFDLEYEFRDSGLGLGGRLSETTAEFIKSVPDMAAGMILMRGGQWGASLPHLVRERRKLRDGLTALGVDHSKIADEDLPEALAKAVEELIPDKDQKEVTRHVMRKMDVPEAEIDAAIEQAEQAREQARQAEGEGSAQDGQQEPAGAPQAAQDGTPFDGADAPAEVQGAAAQARSPLESGMAVDLLQQQEDPDYSQPFPGEPTQDELRAEFEAEQRGEQERLELAERQAEARAGRAMRDAEAARVREQQQREQAATAADSAPVVGVATVQDSLTVAPAIQPEQAAAVQANIDRELDRLKTATDGLPQEFADRNAGAYRQLEQALGTGDAGKVREIVAVLARKAKNRKDRVKRKASEVAQMANEAATSPANDKPEPTEAQKKAGNYEMGHAEVHGMDISVENPAGSVRSGRSRDGRRWRTVMKHHYGYIRGTVGKDKDHIDVFVNPAKPEGDAVHVVNQIDPATGTFDEHKAMFGWGSVKAAESAYLANYEKGWKGAQSITPMTVDEFRAWAFSTEPSRGAVVNDRTKHTKTADSKTEPAKSQAVEGKPKVEQAGTLANLSAEKQARAEELKARIRGKLNALNSVMPDPTLMADGIELTGLYVESGIRRFADFARDVFDAFGEKAKPYMRAWWAGAQDMPGAPADMEDVSRDEARKVLDELGMQSSGQAPASIPAKPASAAPATLAGVAPVTVAQAIQALDAKALGTMLKPDNKEARAYFERVTKKKLPPTWSKTKGWLLDWAEAEKYRRLPEETAEDSGRSGRVAMPKTKRGIESAYRLHMAVQDILGDPDTGRFSDKRKRKFESAMQSIFTHAERAGIDRPAIGTYFSEEDYRAKAQAVLDMLPPWDDVYRAKSGDDAKLGQEPEGAKESGLAATTPTNGKPETPRLWAMTQGQYSDWLAKRLESMPGLAFSGGTSAVDETIASIRQRMGKARDQLSKANSVEAIKKAQDELAKLEKAMGEAQDTRNRRVADMPAAMDNHNLTVRNWLRENSDLVNAGVVREAEHPDHKGLVYVQTAKQHRDVVRDAIQKGYLVPAEVLAEYPDLDPAAKLAPGAANQAPWTTPEPGEAAVESAPRDVPEMRDPFQRLEQEIKAATTRTSWTRVMQSIRKRIDQLEGEIERGETFESEPQGAVGEIAKDIWHSRNDVENLDSLPKSLVPQILRLANLLDDQRSTVDKLVLQEEDAEYKHGFDSPQRKQAAEAVADAQDRIAEIERMANAVLGWRERLMRRLGEAEHQVIQASRIVPRGEKPLVPPPARAKESSSPKAEPVKKQQTIDRKTPRKGTPEREKMDAEWRDAEIARDTAAVAAREADDAADKKQQGTKAQEQAERKARKLSEESYAIYAKTKELAKTMRQAWAEDDIEDGNPIVAAKARERLGELTWAQTQELVDAEIDRRGKELGATEAEIAAMQQESKSYTGMSRDNAVEILLATVRSVVLKEQARETVKRLPLEDFAAADWLQRIANASIWPEDIQRVVDQAKNASQKYQKQIAERRAIEKSAAEQKAKERLDQATVLLAMTPEERNAWRLKFGDTLMQGNARFSLRRDADKAVKDSKNGSLMQVVKVHGGKGWKVVPTSEGIDKYIERYGPSAPDVAKKPVPTAKATPTFDGLPQKSRDMFDKAYEAGDVDAMTEMLYPDNKAWRAEFAKRTGQKLPPTLTKTREAVAAWAKGFATAPASSDWFASLDAEQQKTVSTEMRRIRAEEETYFNRDRKLAEPGGTLPVGPARFDESIKADVLREMLSKVNRGKSPQEAAAAAKELAREWVRNHNAKRPGDTMWQRDEGTADPLIDDTMRSLLNAAKPVVQEPASQEVHRKGVVYFPTANRSTDVVDVFGTGIDGKNGSQLLAHVHVRREGEKDSADGGLKAAMVSDWDRAMPCAECGRAIVHAWYVADAKGRVRVYGREHLHTALGLTKMVTPKKEKEWLDQAYAFAAKTKNREEGREQRIVRAAETPVESRKAAANLNYGKTGRPLSFSFFAQNRDGDLARVDGTDVEDVRGYVANGFDRVSDPSPYDPDEIHASSGRRHFANGEPSHYTPETLPEAAKPAPESKSGLEIQTRPEGSPGKSIGRINLFHAVPSDVDDAVRQGVGSITLRDWRFPKDNRGEKTYAPAENRTAVESRLREIGWTQWGYDKNVWEPPIVPTIPAKGEKLAWFVNWTEQANVGRTSETRMFDTLREARQFADGKHGYITRQTDGGNRIGTNDSATTFVEYFGEFQPSAQEAQSIKRLTGAEAPTAPQAVKATADATSGEIPAGYVSAEEAIVGLDMDSPEVQGALYGVPAVVRTQIGRKQYAWRPYEIRSAQNQGRLFNVSLPGSEPGPGATRVNAEDVRMAPVRVKEAQPEEKAKPSGAMPPRPELRLTEPDRARNGSVQEQQRMAHNAARVATLRMLNDATNAYPGETFGRLDPAQYEEVQNYMVALQLPERSVAPVVAVLTTQDGVPLSEIHVNDVVVVDLAAGETAFDVLSVHPEKSGEELWVEWGNMQRFVSIADVKEHRKSVSRQARDEAKKFNDSIEKQAAAREEAKRVNESRTSDVGTELVYNKRNRIITGVKWADLEGKETALRVRETTKQKVSPKPDYEGMVGDGMNPVLAHMVKQAYDGIAAKPATSGAPTDAQLQQYIEGVNRVMQAINEWATDGRGEAFVRDLGTRAERRLQAGPFSVSSLMSETSNVVRPLGAVYPDGWRTRREEVMILGGNKFISSLQPGMDEAIRASKEIGLGWPAKTEAWQRRGYKIMLVDKLVAAPFTWNRAKPGGASIPMVSVRFAIDGGGASARSISSVIISDATSVTDPKVIAEVDKARAEMEGKYVLLNKSGQKVSVHDTEADASAAAKGATAPKGKTRIAEEGMAVAQASRFGVSRRPDGVDATSEMLQTTFGFKGVNFGNWMHGNTNEAERQLHLNHAYDSFMDLAAVMGVPPQAMSLNGLLGLAFGAQGSGVYAAHFVPGVNEINLTRTAGAGALAHEWAHGLDHYFARQGGLDRGGDPFMTSHYRTAAFSGLRPEIVAIFRDLVTAMRQRPMTPEDLTAKHQANMDKGRKNMESWLASIRRDFMQGMDESQQVPDGDGGTTTYGEAFDKLANKVRTLDVGGAGQTVVNGRNVSHTLSPVVQQMRDLYQAGNAKREKYSKQQIDGLQGNLNHLLYISDSAAHQKTHEPALTDSKYLKSSQEMDGLKGGKSYWATSPEMFARAFNAFVGDRLAEIDIRNSYLTRAAEEEAESAWAPFGEERQATNALFDKLVSTIKTRETDRGVELYRTGEGISFQDVSQSLGPADKARLLALGKRLFGDEWLTLRDNILTPDGREAMGRYRDGWAEISTGKGDPESTVLHEAVHRAEDLFLTPDELAGLRNAMPDAEARAEGIIQYARDGRGIVGKARQFVARLLRRLRSFLGTARDADKLLDFYDRLLAGEYAKRSTTRDSANAEQVTFRRSDAMSDWEKREAVRTMPPVVVDTSAFGEEGDRSRLIEIGSREYAKLVERHGEVQNAVVNRRDGRRFVFRLGQFGKPASHSADPRIMRAIPGLPAMLEQAMHIYSEQEKDPKKYANIKMWHTYAVKASINGQEVYMQLTTFELKEGLEVFDRYHDHNITWMGIIEKGHLAGPDPVTNRGVTQDGLARNKVYQWWHSVKSPGQDGDYDYRLAEPEAEKSWRVAVGEGISWLGRFFDNRVKDSNARPDLSPLDTVFRTISHYAAKVPALRRMFDTALGHNDNKHRLGEQIFGTGEGDLALIREFGRRNPKEWERANEYLVQRDMDAKGYSARQTDSESWAVINPGGNEVARHDTEAAAWQHARLLESKDLLADGFSKDAAFAVSKYREIADRMYYMIRGEAEELKAKMDELGLPMPEMDDGHGGTIDLFEAIREMGDRRGYYMPRIRTGRYLLHADKDGEQPITEAFDNPLSRRARRASLEKQGYSARLSLSETPSEAAFLDMNLVALNDAVANAVQRMEKIGAKATLEGFGMTAARVTYTRKDGTTERHLVIDAPQRGTWAAIFKDFGGRFYDDGQTDTGNVWHFANPKQGLEGQLAKAMTAHQFGEVELTQAFANTFVKQLAGMIQSRGSLSRRIGRRQATGDEVRVGYERDALRALAMAGHATAGGVAKRMMARDMMRQITGTDIGWAEFRDGYILANQIDRSDPEAMQDVWKAYSAEVDKRRIDSATQPEAYREGTAFMRDMLRNEESSERVFGMVKGVASIKHLSGIAPALVNMTALGTTVPAAMLHYGKIPLARAAGLLTRGATNYGKHYSHARWGKGEGLAGEDAWLFDEISKRGWDDALMNREAVGVLQGKARGAWGWLIEKALLPFSVTERINRASTIAATYYGLRAQGVEQDAALQQAKEISDKAHGVYGKVNLPAWARGPSVGAQTARSFYMYKTFSHTYLQTMSEMGYDALFGDDRAASAKAFAYMMLSPAVFGGGAAMIATPAFALMAKALFAAFGQPPPDDPEEAFYRWAEEEFGDYFGRIPRMGVPGMLGVNLKGSLAIGITDIPTNLKDLLGAPYSLFEDARYGFGDILRGDLYKGAERLAPRMLQGPMRGLREATEGVTTHTNQPLYYGDERLRASWYDAFLRSLAFNPAEISAKRERQWKDRQAEGAYRDERTELYTRMRRWKLSGGGKGEWAKILLDVELYNARVRASAHGNVSFVTEASIKTQLKRMETIERRERIRAGLAERDDPGEIGFIPEEERRAGTGKSLRRSFQSGTGRGLARSF